ncbi:MAG: IS200/IS605 family transposase [Janthinobacterium lividum]
MRLRSALSSCRHRQISTGLANIDGPCKYRRALLTPEVVSELTRIRFAIEERLEFQIEMLGTDKNHVHLLCAAHPKMSVGDIVRIYKSSTARELFKALPRLRKELWGGAFWTSSYFAATAGQFGGYESVKRYVQEQGQQLEDLSLWLEIPHTEKK